MTQLLQQTIDAAWENRAQISPAQAPADVREAVRHVLAELDAGRLRVATREGVGQWTVHQWIKKAVLLSFRLADNAPVRAGELAFFDKVPTKFGIGGVLEPLQASPTIIEDNCFIGARSEVVEGVIVEENSVLGMGVYLGQSTPIFNRETGEISYGRVPAGSVVVSGSLPRQTASGQPYSLYAAVIVKRVDAQTRAKTSINDLLRP